MSMVIMALDEREKAENVLILVHRHILKTSVNMTIGQTA